MVSIISNYTIEKLERLISKLRLEFGEDAPERFLENDLIFLEKQVEYYEEDGVLSFALGISIEKKYDEWLRILGREKLSSSVKHILRNKENRKTQGTGVRVALVSGCRTFGGEKHEKTPMQKFIDFANENRLIRPQPDVACMLLEEMTLADWHRMSMGSIRVMHSPVLSPEGNWQILLEVKLSEKIVSPYRGRSLVACPYFGNDSLIGNDENLLFVEPSVF